MIKTIFKISSIDFFPANSEQILLQSKKVTNLQTMLLETCISLEGTDQSRVSEDKSLKFVALRMHLITKLRFSLKDILSKSINSIAAAADVSEIFSKKKIPTLKFTFIFFNRFI